MRITQQINKVKKYSSVRHLVDIQLTGDDGQLALSFCVNAEEMEHSKERDGRYLLVTNRPLSDEEMLSHFKGQDREAYWHIQGTDTHELKLGKEHQPS